MPLARVGLGGRGYGRGRRLPRLSMRETFAALLSGLVAGLSQPLVLGAAGRPLDDSGLSGLLALVAFVPALVAARRGTVARAYGVGVATFWVYLVVVVHWLVVPFAVYAGAPTPLAVLAVLLATGAVALLLAAPFALSRAAEQRLAWPAWLSFPAALAGVELLRNSVPFGGVPWASVGSALGSVDVMRQGASLFGVYGLAFVVGLSNALCADVIVARRGRRRAPLVGLALGGALLVALVAYGLVRLSAPAGEPAITVGLLQPSVAQEVINAGRSADEIRARYQALQQEAVTLGADVVVWPEAALSPAVPADSASLREAGVVAAGSLVPPAAIVGALSWSRGLNADSGRLERSLRTSAFVTGRDLAVSGRYDKVRLMPFGEYVPWPLSLAFDKLVTADGVLTPGATPRAIPLEPLGGAKVGVTICWDGLFPEVARALVKDGAVQLYNLTNDAWYGRTSQPWQHLAAYALRATETGRPVVRAANSGVSGWFDARGRFHGGTEPFTSTALIAAVPTSSELTPYVRFGEWVALPCLVLTALLSLLLLLGRSRAGR